MEDVLIVVSIQCYSAIVLLDNDEVCDLDFIILPDGSCKKNSYFKKLYKIIQKIGCLLRTFKKQK